MYFFYSFFLFIGFLLALPYFLFIAWRDGKYRVNFWQRLGYLPEFERGGSKKPVVWLHCVSVGETMAAKPLVKALLSEFSDYNLVVSTTTVTGQKLAREIFAAEAVLIFYFPFDFRFAVRRALQIIRPQVVLIMETEIWLNFLRECGEQHVRTAIVNGRLSEKSFRNYRLISFLMAKGLQNLDLALMQNEADAKRLADLGLAADKISITGNIKFDIEEASENNLTPEFRARFGIDGERKLIIAASTHTPEEKWLLEAFQQVRASFAAGKPRFLIAPRHPERFAEVAGLLEKSGVKFARRSQIPQISDKNCDVILLDSVGELRSVFSLAEIVFVGGSLIPKGGHNILEPASAQKCVVTGFYTFNFTAIVKEFLLHKALVQLPKLEDEEIPAQLARVFTELLGNEQQRQQLAANGRHVLQKNRGATEKTVRRLKDVF